MTTKTKEGRTMKAIKVRDAGDEFADRYGIMFDTGDVFNMSSDADMPNGCCIYVGNINEDYAEYDFVYRSRKVDPETLPTGTKRQITYIEKEAN
jgi:hypothetical protein